MTFHIIFQGQFLPPSFSWKSLALFYQTSKKREIADGEEEEKDDEKGKEKQTHVDIQQQEQEQEQEQVVVEELSDSD